MFRSITDERTHLRLSKAVSTTLRASIGTPFPQRRIQSLAGFFRLQDASYLATGHKARKVRVTGYLLWDDDHNGSADVGSTIQYFSNDGFHHPWRSTAWEIHPIMENRGDRMNYWEIIADNLSKAGWSWGCVAAVDSNGRTMWIADAHRCDGKRALCDRLKNFA